MNITCFNTWNDFLRSKLVDLTVEEDVSFHSDFKSSDSPWNKWLCVASEAHQLALAKVENNPHPIILHSFLTIQGNRKEFGVSSIQPVIHSGMARRAQAATVDAEDMFMEREVTSYSLQPLFKTDSVDSVTALINKAKTKASNPATKLPSSKILPKHIAEVLLEAEGASTADLFLLAKEAVISKRLTMDHEDEEMPGEIRIATDGEDGDLLLFSKTTVMEQGGDVLQWMILTSAETDMTAIKTTVPMTGKLIQDASAQLETSRLGREAPQASLHTSTNDRASLAETFEKLKDILHGATDKLVEKTHGSKVHDKLFLTQLRMAASRDKTSQGDLSETGMLIWKTKDLDSKKALFARELRAKGVEDAALSAAQAKCSCTGDWHFNSATPGGTSLHLMSAPGVDNEDIEDNSRIIATKLQLKLAEKITESEFRKYSDKSIKVPTSLEEMIEVFQLQCTCFEVFLTGDSIVVDSYQSFIKELQNMKRRLRKKIAGDKDYIFSLMHLVDMTWNDFFEQCCMHFDRPELIEFENIELDQKFETMR